MKTNIRSDLVILNRSAYRRNQAIAWMAGFSTAAVGAACALILYSVIL